MNSHLDIKLNFALRNVLFSQVDLHQNENETDYILTILSLANPFYSQVFEKCSKCKYITLNFLGRISYNIYLGMYKVGFVLESYLVMRKCDQQNLMQK